MFKFTIKIAALKATAIAAGSEAIRYYLNGVCIEWAEDGPIFVATDGRRLIAARHNWMDGKPFVEMFPPVIIPLSLIKKVKIGKKVEDAILTLERNPDKGFKISIDYCGAVYSENAIDATFPDWRRVLPGDISGDLAQFNPDYIADFKRAAEILDGGKTDVLTIIRHNGNSPALVDLWRKDEFVEAFGVLMPMRVMRSPLDRVPEWKPKARAEKEAENA